MLLENNCESNLIETKMKSKNEKGRGWSCFKTQPLQILITYLEPGYYIEVLDPTTE